MTIQYINFRGSFTSTTIKVNKISAPESFDDYEYNIVDLSGDDLWKYADQSPTSINHIDDIRSLSAMINTTQNKVLIVLPQNIKYYYDMNYSGKEYYHSCELKNIIPLITSILEILLGLPFDKSWLMYNKTKSIIQGNEMSCDFVFHNVDEELAITSSATGKSITTIHYGDTHLTTLKLKSESDISDFMQELKWTDQTIDMPQWVDNIDCLDDTVLKEEKKIKYKALQELENNIQLIDKRLSTNREYKTVLFANGDQLVKVVSKMLDEMIGYDYENFTDKKEEDFRIQYNDLYFIGEIKGISSNVKRSNILQAATHKSLFMEKEGNEDKEVYAIAIINRQRNISPMEREPISNDVIKLAKSNDVLLIPTESFLRLFELFKNGTYSTEEVVKLLMQSGGLFEIK